MTQSVTPWMTNPDEEIPPDVQAAIQSKYGGVQPQITPFQQQTAVIPDEAKQAVSDLESKQQAERTNLGLMIENSLQGNQSVIPGGVRKVAYEIGQQIPGPIPGANEMPGFQGTEAGMAAEGDQYSALAAAGKDPYSATIGTGKSRRLAIEPTSDLDTLARARVLAQQGTPESEYAAAGRALREQEDFQRLGQEQIFEDRIKASENEERTAWIDKTADEINAQATRDEVDRRRQALAVHMPRIEALLEKRIAEAESPEKPEEGGSIANAIALALSTLGSGLTGAPNVVLELMKLDEDKKINKLKADAEQYNGIRNLYTDMLSMYQDPDAAEMAARYAIQSAQANEVKARAARERGEQAKALLLEVGAAKDNERLQTKKASLEGEHRTLWRDVPARVVGTPGGLAGYQDRLKKLGVPAKDIAELSVALIEGGPEGAAKRLRELYQDGGDSFSGVPTDPHKLGALKYINEHKVTLPDGTPVFTPDRDKVQTAVTVSNRARESIARLRKISTSETMAKGIRDPNVLDDILANTKALNNDFRLLFEQGVQQEHEMKANQATTGEVMTNMFSSNFWDPRHDRAKFFDKIERSIINSIEKSALATAYSDPQMTKPFKREPRKVK